MAGRRARGRDGPREEVASGTAELVADRDRPRAWTLVLDGAPQSHVDLDDPAHLEFEYMRRLGHVVDLVAPPRRPVRALHLGGGALTLPRYVAATRPRSGQQVVELDGGLVEFVRRELPLDRAARIRVRTGDAREILERAPDAAFDLVVADVFAEARIPPHLTSVEFVAAAARALDVAGVYAANVTDGKALAFTRAQVATVRAVFRHTCLLADPAVLRGRRFGNLVLLGSHRELPVIALAARAAADPFPGRVVHGPDLVAFGAGFRPVADAAAVASPAPPDGAFDPRA